jgi:hypothetical protein
MIRIKSFAVNLGVLLATLVILMLILEGGLAIARINTKSNVRFIPGKGITFIPNVTPRRARSVAEILSRTHNEGIRCVDL